MHRRDRTNPTETQRNAQGCVVPTYPTICATQNCFNCEDFQYQENAQNFFNAFPNDPSGLDGKPTYHEVAKVKQQQSSLPTPQD